MLSKARSQNTTKKRTPDFASVAMETRSDSNNSSSSSGEDSQTDSTDSEPESPNNSQQDKDLKPAVTLSCLRKWDTEKMNTCFQNYLSKLKTNGAHTSQNIGVPKLSKIEDFTPWWDEFSKPVKRSTTERKATPSKDSDTFDNWFDKTRQGSSTSSWLCGPGPSKPSEDVQSQHSAPIEDIEVPSIYNQTPTTKGRRALKRERKAEREKTLGKKWFEMRAPEVDDAVRMDMEMIRMRGVLDPKRFYKNNDRRALPKYFQMGTVVDEGTDFYSSRLTKKQRKKTLVEELMADADVRQYNKRKYSEVQQKMRSKKKFKGNKSSAS